MKSSQKDRNEPKNKEDIFEEFDKNHQLHLHIDKENNQLHYQYRLQYGDNNEQFKENNIQIESNNEDKDSQIQISEGGGKLKVEASKINSEDVFSYYQKIFDYIEKHHENNMVKINENKLKEYKKEKAEILDKLQLPIPKFLVAKSVQLDKRTVLEIEKKWEELEKIVKIKNPDFKLDVENRKHIQYF